MSGKVESETELIQTYLAPLTRGASGAFNLADDAALIAPEPGTDLVLSTDPVVAGVHFFVSDRADDIAWKAIAVNVSDLIAKGAEPLAYTLALAFPEPPERAWMADFAGGLASAQAAFGCHLIGGDTDRTTGPLSIGVTAIGVLPRGSFVRRLGAEAGHHVFVTGTIGDSALGLALHRDPSLYGTVLTEGDRGFLLGRYLRPNPRLAMAPVLRAYASAALDVSDGLAKDLARLAGGCGIRVTLESLPLSPSARTALASDPRVIDAAISGGDDYEVLFAIPPEQLAGFAKAIALAAVATTHLGILSLSPGVVFLDGEGQIVQLGRTGYDHFGAA